MATGSALEGHPLTAGHPVYDVCIGRLGPLASQSQNSITYGDLAGEAEFRTRPCACGCARLSTATSRLATRAVAGPET